ncbi:lysophospholipase, putative [Plasmodium chabaudi chabaudi]|uniref:Lysophospholipase, putative n=1 Tax=Plasmodium chabaudi chabaudi TaxID=31271 RepID=A0A4V0KAB5_PLACU|nr:lysophospholipase, putative [Plasmodium chabaudi chabaudi]VTZ69979.1 lysophospholipase, putative [Plasmodium chabaudi chabaudi]|eukprot:XP_016654410.1 lysophospholipase, putative [Plasmodium chabaudi chabaudi]
MEEIELNGDELRNTACNLDGNPKVGWLCNKNGLLLKTYEWVTHGAIGIILLIHGLKAHTRLTFMKINLKMPNANEGLVIDTDNYYIYKDSWIEKFNQNGYSVYALDFQGHGESQSWRNIRGDFKYYDDLVDDVLQYMNQIHDEISNDNQMNEESHNIVATKKERLPMYIMGHSMGGTIALRILQLLKKKQEDKIKMRDSNSYKSGNAMLNDSTNVNKIGNNVVEDMINDKYDMDNTHFITNSSDYYSDNSCASTCASTSASISATANVVVSSKDEECYNYLDKFNIKGCIALSGMMRAKTPLGSGNRSIKYLYLPIANFMSRVAPRLLVSRESHYKRSEYVANICKYDKFRNNNGVRFKCFAELMRAMIKLHCDINYMPENVPLLFVHSKDDTICCYKAAYSFYNKAKVPGKKFHTVDDMGHAITAEEGNEDILNEILNWISYGKTNYEDIKEGEKEGEKKIKKNAKKKVKKKTK